MQDIAENGADVNHFSHVHKASAFAGPKEYERVASTSWLRRAMTFEFDVKWSEHDFKVLVDQDTLIWDHKTFLKNPGLVKEDSAIKTFREWYAQFYSSKSLTWRDVKEKTLVW
ncbi:hypothetical protein IscW_ISCW010159 [Ixodes scapularis]|uniref:3-ketosteroid-9-alpha-monooxygenase oxygenase component-like C-terminal domain-containing protein n=1 Tax=Ixodes scapularis TaxID=6945 RepID=B7PZK4_IXOSC|nr:hypothetical protein IscW_ISCW010159 [Ixodes scapularis]|eukprot:XP_002405357.1 hypothetical protein IscW_ISCW010159 [Ixodes scapularis]